MTRRIALLMTVLALVATACGTGQELAEVETVAAAAPVVSETAPAPESGDGVGIQVHGHWTIEVRNPDGSLDARYEFENALTDSGRGLLVNRVFGSINLTSWQITADGDAGALTISNPTVSVVDGPSGEMGVLTGTASAVVDFEIADVATSALFIEFTRKTLDAPIPVINGQEVEITVEISFS